MKWETFIVTFSFSIKLKKKVQKPSVKRKIFRCVNEEHIRMHREMF